MSLPDENDGWGGDTPQSSHHAAPYLRPSTPDQTSDNEPLHPNLPGTPESVGLNSCNPESGDDKSTFKVPPISLTELQWAAPPVVQRHRLVLKEPKGIQDTNPTHNSRWHSIYRKVVDLYKYTRISQDEVRLILLKPGTFEEDIYVSIWTIRDEELGTKNYPYVALSYHWGNGNEDNTIFVQEDPRSKPLRSIDDVVDATRPPKQLKIRPNLYEALKYLRREKHTVAIWIDAICINQLDRDERSDQVNKMALIYQKAYNVNIWLGSDGAENPVSELAMSFIPKVIDLNKLDSLLKDDVWIKYWASLYELLRWSWFSRRWIIQEVAFAQKATVHCGKLECSWSDFEVAIGLFCKHFESLKPKLRKYFDNTQPDIWVDDSEFEVEPLGARLLVDMTAQLFRKKSSRESTLSLEYLVCRLSVFDSSDPRDTIYALRNICRELNQPNSDGDQQVPTPDYSKDLFEVYQDFLKWVITTSASLDILCHFWALKESTMTSPTYPRLVNLPSYIQFADDSAWGKGVDVFNGRKAGDNFVGLPGFPNYNASGTGGRQRRPVVRFPEESSHDGAPKTRTNSNASSDVHHDTSLFVRGFIIGAVSFRTDPFADGVISKACLEGLGWTFDRHAKEIPEVPDSIWRTLVADKGPTRGPPEVWYKKACQYLLAMQTQNGHINIEEILKRSSARGQLKDVQDYLRRVKAVTWNRSFIKGDAGQSQDPLVGFAPPHTRDGDVIAILFGCSVPVILRPLYSTCTPNHVDAYQFVGEAFIYGKMDGEALDKDFHEQEFKLV